MTLAEAEDLPGHGAAVRVRCAGPVTATEWRCPLRDELGGSSRTARRSSTYPVALNVNENPYPPSRGGGRRRRRRGRRRRRAG